VPWNGYYKGKLCPQGVYVWYVEGKYANGKPFKKVGDVTLLHLKPVTITDEAVVETGFFYNCTLHFRMPTILAADR